MPPASRDRGRPVILSGRVASQRAPPMSAPPRFASSLPDASAPVRATWTSHFFNTGLAFRAMYGMASALPRPIASALAFGGTRIAHWTLRGTRTAVAANFRGAFPELSPAAIDALTLRAYHSY